MKKLKFKCTLLSDVIMTSDGATESPSDALDYIPGVKFLGIVAGKLYDENKKEETLDLFHNGVVKYGDATLFHKGELCLKAPFSWFHEKGRGVEEEIYLHHLLESTDKQLKQVRAGYFSPASHALITLEQNYSLKSAQDIEKRRSKESQMFGYQSLNAGTEWVFEVTDEKGVYIEQIKNILVGKHRIGRSRSAEYGLVEVEFLKESLVEPQAIKQGNLVIYAKSNLCFINQVTGSYTPQPTPEQLCGDKDATILWDKCQIRSRSYRTWNRHRKNKDADRLIIERGSVFIVQPSNDILAEFFKNGIGSHLHEGFGQVLVNPDFLTSSRETLEFSLNKHTLKTFQRSYVENGESDGTILKALENINLRNDLDYRVDKAVNQFKKDYEGVFRGLSNSQWGTLRNYAKNVNKRDYFTKMVFDKSSGFLYTGQSEVEWRKKDRRVVLKSFLDLLNEEEFFPFVLKLSSQMSKLN